MTGLNPLSSSMMSCGIFSNDCTAQMGYLVRSMVRSFIFVTGVTVLRKGSRKYATKPLLSSMLSKAITFCCSSSGKGFPP